MPIDIKLSQTKSTHIGSHWRPSPKKNIQRCLILYLVHVVKKPWLRQLRHEFIHLDALTSPWQHWVNRSAGLRWISVWDLLGSAAVRRQTLVSHMSRSCWYHSRSGLIVRPLTQPPHYSGRLTRLVLCCVLMCQTAAQSPVFTLAQCQFYKDMLSGPKKIFHHSELYCKL